MAVVPLEGVLRRYEWGSPTAIPRLLGVEPDGRPAAELWFGAHPDDPSPAGASTLDELVAADPAAALGTGVVDRFGPRLPFLLKVLAAEKALSIQVHPARDEAEEGFAREDAAGLDRRAPNRNYRDRNHKPELVCALTDFEALCGFRPVAETRALLSELRRPELGFVTAALDGDDPLRAAFTAILTAPDPAPAVAALSEAAAASRDERLAGVRLAAQDFPGDVGVLVAVLLGYVRLRPGEAIFLGAGNVHAYLRGTGVEIMANSDNVLRCGLTPKHVDVPEVLRITRFDELADPRWPAVGGSFAVPVPDFRLTRLDVEEPTRLDDPGPLVVLVTEGDVRVADVPLGPGRAAFVPAGEPVTVAGAGIAFVAGTGD
jgi:mannose-6-phosphate isomerase